MKNKNVTILVNSCDLYEDAWYPFFKLFQIQWPNCPYSFLLNTETKDFNTSIPNITTFKGGNVSWSDRVLNAVNTIDSEYILFFLEDFFLISPVKENIFEIALTLIEENKEIGVINLNPDIDTRAWITKGNYNEYYCELKRWSDCRINAVAALWRKDFLIKMLKRGESPWEFEVNGSKRARFCKEKILCLSDPKHAPFDFHLYIKEGYGISRKSWLPKNKELFEKHGINVNYDNLGWYVAPPKRIKRSLKEKVLLIFNNPKELMGMVKLKVNRLIVCILKKIS